MMKKIVLLFLIIPFLSISQEEGDWFPIPSDQVTYFKRNLAIFTMKIDSIVENDTALIYYNLRSPEIIYGTEDYNVYDPYTSWLGKYISVQEDVITFFSIKDFSQMPIYYKRTNNQPWHFITLDNGYYFEAYVDGFDEREITNGLVDSVKYIRFAAYDPFGNPTSEYTCNDTLILSKNYGFAKVFSFEKSFYASWASRSAYGIEVNNVTYGFENKLAHYFNSYEIDFQLHFERSNKSYGPFKKEIMDKIVKPNYIDYDLAYCYENGDYSLETKRFYPTVYPGQSILFDTIDGAQGIYRVFRNNNWNGVDEVLLQFYDSYVAGRYNGQYAWYQEIQTGNCLYDPIYRVNEYFWAMEEICPDDDMIIQYVKAGEFEFGEPYTFDCEVGTNDLEDSSINIAPNPSNGLFYITSSEQIEEIKVYNVNGQLVWQELQVESKSIDLSNQFPGIYFVELMFSNGHIQTTKLLLNP